jgi:hypothetical protein
VIDDNPLPTGDAASELLARLIVDLPLARNRSVDDHLLALGVSFAQLLGPASSLDGVPMFAAAVRLLAWSVASVLLPINWLLGRRPGTSEAASAQVELARDGQCEALPLRGLIGDGPLGKRIRPHQEDSSDAHVRRFTDAFTVLPRPQTGVTETSGEALRKLHYSLFPRARIDSPESNLEVPMRPPAALDQRLLEKLDEVIAAFNRCIAADTEWLGKSVGVYTTPLEERRA